MTATCTNTACSYSAVEVADFTVNRHLHHGCMVEQCILVKRAWSRCRQISNCGDMIMGGIMTFLMRFIFNIIIFIFFPATRVNICSQPVRKTCNQFGMALFIIMYTCNTYYMEFMIMPDTIIL